MKIAIVAVLAALTLAACGGVDQSGVTQSSVDAPSWVVSFYVDSVDGRRVPCIFAKEGYGGGLSCGWSR